MRRVEISEMQWSYRVEESCWILGRWRGTVGWGWCSYVQLSGMDGVAGGGGGVAVSSPCFSMRNVYCMMALEGGLLAPGPSHDGELPPHCDPQQTEGDQGRRGGGSTNALISDRG